MPRDLYIYNTATRSKERFSSDSGKVGIYCCGPTVYDRAHIGNLRTYIWEDVLVKTIRAIGYPVTHVMNITDVGHLTSDEDSGEDKMEKGARRDGKTAWDIARFYMDAFKADLKALNCNEPDIWCRATDHVPEMIALVADLDKKGFTYRTGDGIYFDAAKFPRYCDFARLDPEALRAGARIDMGEKRNPTDFALWKFSPQGARRQMEWESPWGRGFPGWHIECSAMSLRYLDQPVDIHCGGQEHVRVHHTNEIAQSEAATGKSFVRYWVHGEWLMFDAGKMSKSGGGVVSLDELKKEGISAQAYRMFVFSAHHRTPLTFSWDGVQGAANGLKGLTKIVADIAARASDSSRQAELAVVEEVLDPFYGALCDDFNTPKALAAIWELVRDPKLDDAVKLCAVKSADTILSLDLLTYTVNTGASVVLERQGLKMIFTSATALPQSTLDDVAGKILQRKQARASRDFARADAIRSELAAVKAVVKDLPDGSIECAISE